MPPLISCFRWFASNACLRKEVGVWATKTRVALVVHAHPLHYYLNSRWNSNDSVSYNRRDALGYLASVLKCKKQQPWLLQYTTTVYRNGVIKIKLNFLFYSQKCWIKTILHSTHHVIVRPQFHRRLVIHLSRNKQLTCVSNAQTFHTPFKLKDVNSKRLN